MASPEIGPAPVSSPESAGRAGKELAEALGKIAVMVEAAYGGDLRDGSVCCEQQVGGGF